MREYMSARSGIDSRMNPYTGGWKDGTKPKKKNLGAIIGGAVSGVAGSADRQVGGALGGILLIGLVIFFIRRRAAKKAKA